MDQSARLKTFLSLTEAAKDHLRFLSQLGCTEAACSEKSLGIISSWEICGINADIRACRRCPTAGHENRPVCGLGNPEARLMLIGGFPEPEDAFTGKPYSGPAGELLTKMISAMGLSRESVYITHAVKCRPPANRPPSRKEMKTCGEFLYREIEALRPKMICTLGETAARSVLEVFGSFSRIRGRFCKFNGIDVMPTHGPEYLLETPSAKQEAWQDIQQVMGAMGGLQADP